MKNISLSLLIILLFFSNTKGQLFESEVYNVDPLVDGVITLAAFGMSQWGLTIADKKPLLDSIEISQLDANDINAFDRSATEQDASKMYEAWDMSGYGMTGSMLLPVLLLIDKEIRNDWAPVLLLYLQAEGMAGTIWAWGAAIHIDRIRLRNRNSFYSGHTYTSATASFFTAKIYCDYHPELGNKKFIFYGLAIIPPAFTGYYRYKGMKHFPTDVLTGMAVGAATWILIPHFNKHRDNNLTLIPVTGQYTGFAMKLKF